MGLDKIRWGRICPLCRGKKGMGSKRCRNCLRRKRSKDYPSLFIGKIENNSNDSLKNHVIPVNNMSERAVSHRKTIVRTG